MAGAEGQSRTGDQKIDGLFSGLKWSGDVVRFNFPRQADYYGENYGGYGEPGQFFAVSASFQAMARAALDEFASVCGLSFREVGANASSDISVARSGVVDDIEGRNFRGYGYYPNVTQRAGDIWFDDDFNRVADTQILGGGVWRLVMHELGHAVGLKHSFEDVQYGRTPDEYDFNTYTVMSYASSRSGPNEITSPTFNLPQSLMMLDIAALQAMYGANFDSNAGATTYRWNASTGQMTVDGVDRPEPGLNRIYQTIWDGGGRDTYDLSNYRTDLSIDLRPGAASTFSSRQLAILDEDSGETAIGNLFNALLFEGDRRSLIENATGGSGDDEIVGNVGANVLRGRGGDDELLGGGGRDVLDGGRGKDELSGGQGSDRFVFRTVGEVGLAQNRDVILDFAPGSDRIDLRAIDANGRAPGDAFVFLAPIDSEFTGAGGELRWFQLDLRGRANDVTLLEGDVDGDRAADFQLELRGLKTLVEDSILL